MDMQTRFKNMSIFVNGPSFWRSQLFQRLDHGVQSLDVSSGFWFLCCLWVFWSRRGPRISRPLKTRRHPTKALPRPRKRLHMRNKLPSSCSS